MQVVPLLRKCSLAGHAEFKTRDTVFSDNELAPDMLLDVLSDRGFSGSHVINERIIPAKVRVAAKQRFELTRLAAGPHMVPCQHGHLLACWGVCLCLRTNDVMPDAGCLAHR